MVAILKEGWLNKLGTAIKKWQTRWFILRIDGSFQGFQQKPALGVDPLNKYRIEANIKIQVENSDTMNAFVIRVFQGSTFVTQTFSTDATEERTKWIDAITKVSSDLKRGDSDDIKYSKEISISKNKASIVQLGSKTIDDFELLKVVGKGAFAKVFLCIDRETQEILALKSLKKNVILINDEVPGVIMENRVLQRINHPFLTSLKYSFQTRDSICFVTEFVRGGDLLFHIQRVEVFSENRTRFYGAEILLGIEYLHKLGIIYRHLKLETIMLEQDGHIKIINFRLCKENIWYGSTTSTFCGTPDCISPEILQESPYGRATDWWGLGVVMYEMMVGRPPFEGKDEAEQFERILTADLKFPARIPDFAKNFLSGLLKKNPTQRLGGGPEDAVEIKEHVFFENINFKDIYEKKVPAPFLPTLNSEMDVANFDIDFTSKNPNLTPPNENEPSYTDSYQHFINSKDSLDLLFLKFLFVGPPRLGKTTACRRLMGQIKDLISAGEDKQPTPSTGTVETGNVVVRNVSNTTAVITQTEWSAVTTLQEEAHMLLFNLLDSIDCNPKHLTANLRARDNIIHDQSTIPMGDTVKKTSSHTPEQPASIHMQEKTVTDVKPSESSSQPISFEELEVAAIFKEAMDSEHWKDIKHMFKAYLRMEDTGGQPELMDMLPALTIGPGLYLLFINLQNNLDDHYKLTYCNASGESTLPVESTYTVKDMLLSSLSSISCSNALSSISGFEKEEATSATMSDILKCSKSVAYIVGTYKDKVSKERIKMLNQQLQRCIESTDFYDKDVVQFFSEDELIVTLDNMGGGAEEINNVQKLLESSMEKHFKKLRIPAVWLFFSLYLRNKKMKTATLDYCFQISALMDMSAQETKIALWFLHHHAGVMMYFPNILELKDLVIIDIQVVYDSVTILIVKAMSYDKVGHKNAQNFKKTGTFLLSRIISAMSEVSGDYIPPRKLVSLLDFLHIIARISSSQQSQSLKSSKEDEITYIMPCVLLTATMEELKSISKKPHEVCPIMVRFKCGFVPIGFFPAVVANLIANKSFNLIQEGIRKNIVQFRYGTWRTLLTLFCHSTHYEIRISKFVSSKIEPHVECAAIRNMIESTFAVVSSRMNYGSFLDYQFAFKCPIDHDNCQEHLCIVDRSESIFKVMDCLLNVDCPEPVELTGKHNLWFGQPLSGPEISTHSQDTCDSSPSQFHESVTSCASVMKVFQPTEISSLNTKTADQTVELSSPRPVASMPTMLSVPTIKKLTILKWKNSAGATERVTILDDVCSEWKRMGDLLALNPGHLKAIENDNRGVAYDCCRAVFHDWLQEEEGEYSVTWEGLCELLEDMQLSNLANRLRKILPH